MSLGLLTGGYEGTAGSTGGGGGAPTGIRIPFELRDADGVLQAGIDLSAAGVTQLSLNGANFANRVGAAPHSIGGGAYYYELDATEVLEPWVILKIEKGGYQTVLERWDISDDAETILAAVTVGVNAIESAISSTQTAVNAHVDSATAALAAQLDLLLGLHRRNTMLDGGPSVPDIQYDSHRLMVAARLRVFSSPAALAAAVAGHANNADGEIARYALVGVDNGTGLLSRMTFKQELP